MRDLHYNEQRFRNIKERIDKNTYFSVKENNNTAVKFINYYFSNGKGYPKLINYLSLLRACERIVKKDFRKYTIEDIYTIISELKQRNFSSSYIAEYQKTIKKFFGFLKRTDIITNIKVEHRNNVLPELTITKEDVFRMINATNNLAHKLYLALALECSGRPSEILNLRIKDIEIVANDLAYVTLNGKTGERRLPLCNVLCNVTSLLKVYLETHPNKDLPNEYLFINELNKKPMTYSGFRKWFDTLAKRVGLNGRITPYTIRHLSLTEYSKLLSESILKVWAGWTAGSDMAKVYVHLSCKDLLPAIAKIKNINVERLTNQNDLTILLEDLENKLSNSPEAKAILLKLRNMLK